MSEEQRALRAGASAEPAAAPSIEPAAAVSQPLLPHLRAVFRSMRPRQWTKNLIVFMALLFSADQEWQAHDPSSWLPLVARVLVTFALFCLISSADYLINDVIDRESDALHPEKRRRPIAAGKLSARAAVSWAIALDVFAISAAFALSGWMTWHVGAVLSGYTVLMLAYTFWLKHIVLIDMMVIGAGFVLRAMAGALAIDVPISPWLYVVTALAALFLIIYKRRAEITLLESGAAEHRPILDEYSAGLLDQMASLVTASTLVAYGLYTFTAENLPANHAMMLTIPFVLYGFLRYLYLVHQKGVGGSPEEVLLKDWPLLADMIAWIATAATILILYRD